MEKTLRGLTASHTRGEEEEKERRESYHTWRFYHMVMPQAFNRFYESMKGYPWIVPSHVLYNDMTT
jgi:hypothetical protein